MIRKIEIPRSYQIIGGQIKIFWLLFFVLYYVIYVAHETFCDIKTIFML